MNNSFFKYGLIILGEILLIAGLYLYFEEEAGEKWFWLNMIVMSFVYLTVVLIRPVLYVSAKEFERGVTGHGIVWFFTGIYALLAVAGVIAGVAAEISFEWQCLYQVAFAVFYGVGMYWAKLSSEKLREVGKSMTEEYDGINRIKEDLDLLHFYTTQKALPGDIKDELVNLSKRLEYLSPNTSTAAVTLERGLCKAISDLSLLMKTTPVPATDVRQGVQLCENILKERLKLANKI